MVKFEGCIPNRGRSFVTSANRAAIKHKNPRANGREPRYSGSNGNSTVGAEHGQKLDFAVWYSALAALLVFNSHLEKLYPRAWMAGDGLLGNSMFFFLSGWGLSNSWSYANRSFLDYAQRRFLRIYPTLVVTVLLLEWLPGKSWYSWQFTDYIQKLLYPTSFTYVRVIVPGYLLLFLMLRFNLLRWSAIAMGAMSSWYLLLYATHQELQFQPSLTLGSVPNCFHLLYYYCVIVLGAYIARHEFYFDSSILIALVTGGTVFAYLAIKFWMALTHQWYLFPILHVLCIATLVPLFETARLCAATIRGGMIEKSLTLVGGLTLEIYLTHELLLRLLPIDSRYFPLEIVFLFSVTLCVSYLIKKLVLRIEPRQLTRLAKS